MGYDLSFWKYKKGAYLDHQEVYEKCSFAKNVEGLEDLPIPDIIASIQKEFTDWKMLENEIDFENPKGKGAFGIYPITRYVCFHCYGMTGKDMNRIIDVMFQYDCPLYDPQVPQRFDEL